MLESLLSGFANISVPELVLIAGMALVASVVGGVAGYGTGALMPLVLVPIVGAEPVVPILSLSALFTNTSRSAAFWPLIDQRRAWIVLAAAVPTCALGAWGYTMLTGKGAALVIGGMLMASVPLRRLMRQRGLSLSNRGLAAATVMCPSAATISKNSAQRAGAASSQASSASRSSGGMRMRSTHSAKL